jgi:hypothetical protein
MSIIKQSLLFLCHQLLHFKYFPRDSMLPKNTITFQLLQKLLNKL